MNKINRDDAFLSGDVLSDLRTIGNTLSVWHVANDSINNIDEIRNISVALALNRTKIEKIAYIMLDEAELSKIGIDSENVAGKSPGLKDDAILNMHYDLTNIDYWRIGMLAEYICKLVANGKGLVFTKEEVHNNIMALIAEGKINVDELNEKIREKVNTQITTGAIKSH